MYDYKARTYSPTLGRFMQTDLIGYADGLNWYNYVGGDPVNGSDPSGTSDVGKWQWSCYGNCGGEGSGYWNTGSTWGSGDASSDGGASSGTTGGTSGTPTPAANNLGSNLVPYSLGDITVTAIRDSVNISLADLKPIGPTLAIDSSLFSPQSDVIVTGQRISQYKPRGNIVVPFNFGLLDPANLDRPLFPFELQWIADTLSAISDRDHRSAMARNPHPYLNRPDPRTGAVLPPSPGGYTTFDVIMSSPRSAERLVVNNTTGQVYYTFNHYASFVPIVHGP